MIRDDRTQALTFIKLMTELTSEMSYETIENLCNSLSESKENKEIFIETLTNMYKEDSKIYPNDIKTESTNDEKSLFEAPIEIIMKENSPICNFTFSENDSFLSEISQFRRKRRRVCNGAEKIDYAKIDIDKAYNILYKEYHNFLNSNDITEKFKLESVGALRVANDGKKIEDYYACVKILGARNSFEESLNNFHIRKFLGFLTLIKTDHDKNILLGLIQAWHLKNINRDINQILKLKPIKTVGECVCPDEFIRYPNNKQHYNILTLKGIVQNKDNPRLFAYFIYNKSKFYCYFDDFLKTLNEEEALKLKNLNLKLENTEDSTLLLFLKGRGKGLKELEKIISQYNSERNGLYEALIYLGIVCERSRKLSGTYDDQIEEINLELCDKMITRLEDFFRIDFLKDVVSKMRGSYIILYIRLFSFANLSCATIVNNNIVYKSDEVDDKELVFYMILFIQNN